MTSRFQATFDLIEHHLVCSECRASPANAAELDMQTKIATRPENRVISVGSAVEISDLVADDWYIPVGRSEVPLVVIEHWTCPSCGAWQWAKMRLAQGVLVSIEWAELDEQTMAHSDYVTGAAALMLDSNDIPALARINDEARRRLIADADVARRRTRAQDRLLRLVADRASDLDAHTQELERIVPPAVSLGDLLADLERAADIERHGSMYEVTVAGRERLRLSGM